MRINHVFIGCAASFGCELAAGACAWARKAEAQSAKATRGKSTKFFMPGRIHRPLATLQNASMNASMKTPINASINALIDGALEYILQSQFKNHLTYSYIGMYRSDYGESRNHLRSLQRRGRAPPPPNPHLPGCGRAPGGRNRGGRRPRSAFGFEAPWSFAPGGPGARAPQRPSSPLPHQRPGAQAHARLDRDLRALLASPVATREGARRGASESQTPIAVTGPAG